MCPGPEWELFFFVRLLSSEKGKRKKGIRVIVKDFLNHILLEDDYFYFSCAVVKGGYEIKAILLMEYNIHLLFCVFRHNFRI